MRHVIRLLLILVLAYFVMEWWLNQQKKQATVPVKATPPVKPQTPRTTTSRKGDALTEIDGIGPAYERALQALGIRTFDQLAAQNPDDLAARLSSSSVRVTAARIKRDQWIEQAAAYADLVVSTSSRWSANDGNSA